MDKAITKYLVDIKQAIADIEYFTTQRPRQYTVFCEDLMFRSAIERKIGIIGEAMTKILQIEPSIPITNARKIKGTRNYIVHAYDSLSPEMLWGIVINDLDTLKKRSDEFIGSNKSEIATTVAETVVAISKNPISTISSYG